MASVMSAITNTVPITQFNRGLVVLEHGIDLGSSKHIAARTVDPDGHIALTGIQLIPEHLRSNLISPERFLVDGAFQPEGSGLVTVLDPVPELFHLLLGNSLGTFRHKQDSTLVAEQTTIY